MRRDRALRPDELDCREHAAGERELVPSRTGAGIEQGTVTLAIAGWENGSEAHEALRWAAAWCRDRIRLHAMPVRHIDHDVDAVGYEGLVGEWEVAGSGVQRPGRFPWDELLALIESTDESPFPAPLPTDPCEDIQQEAGEARRRAVQAEEDASRAERGLREAEEELDEARREITGSEHRRWDDG